MPSHTTVAEASAMKAQTEEFLKRYLQAFIDHTSLQIASVVVLPENENPYKIEKLKINVTL